MTEHVLYSFRRCPYAIRARMTLAYAEIKCELRELMLRDKPSDMLAHSPKGTVPVFILNNHTVIDESLDVMLWALKQHDPDDWLKNQTQSMELIEQCDGDFKSLLDRYKYADRHPELTEEAHRQLTVSFIESLNEKLCENQYLTSKQIRLADVAIFPFIRQYAFVNKPWFDQLPYPELQHWLDGFLNSTLFTTIMPKFKLFNDGYSYQFPGGELLTTPEIN